MAAGFRLQPVAGIQASSLKPEARAEAVMLTIRLTRMGSKKRPFFRVVVVEGKSARDGAFVESLGHYNPRRSPEVLDVDRERLAYWVSKGAQPSNTMRTLVARNPAPAAPVAETSGAAGEQPAAS
jgi:small subunit ribosomal protein S16